MYDIRLLLDSSRFDPSPSGQTRIALIHQSFRLVSLRRGVNRQSFAAHFPGLGLLNIAHALRINNKLTRSNRLEIKYFDEESYDDDSELFSDVTDWLSVVSRRIVATSSYTPTIDHLETFLSKFDPTLFLIVVGGAHVTVAPKIDHAHIVVRGEGGSAMCHIVSNFYSGGFGDSSIGICHKLNGVEVIHKSAFDRSMEVLPPPCFAYDLLPVPGDRRPVYSTNFTRMLGDHPQIYVCTQSCIARCTFCSTYLIHGTTVARPLSKVKEDLEYLVKDLGHDSIEFHDDDLLQHPDLDGILEILENLNVSWFCYARADEVSGELAHKMAGAGCKRIFLGIESMHQVTLDYYNKGTTTEENQHAAEQLHAAGIGVVAGFMIGAPHDNIESILSDLDRYLELPLFAINCSILSPDPGTVEFYRAQKKGGDFTNVGVGKGKNLQFRPNPELDGIDAPMGIPAVCNHLTKGDLSDLIKLIDAEFYLRENTWRGLTRNRSSNQIRTIKAYYQYVTMGLHSLYTSCSSPIIRARAEQLKTRINPEKWFKMLNADVNSYETEMENYSSL